MSGAEAARVSIRVEAGLDRTFEAFAFRLGDWWRPHPLFATTPKAPGTMALVDPGPQGRLIETLAGGQTFEVGRVAIWQPPHRLAFSFRPATLGPDQATEVDVSFEPIGDGVRVTLTHRGWARVPQGHVARHGFSELLLMTRLSEWWTRQLARYKGLSLFDSQGS
ncbi:SRPBCC domain-containing protein [soil metagenome]